MLNVTAKPSQSPAATALPEGEPRGFLCLGKSIPGAEIYCYVNFNLVHSADCIFPEI